MGIGHDLSRTDSPLTELSYMANVLGFYSYKDVILYKKKMTIDRICLLGWEK